MTQEEHLESGHQTSNSVYDQVNDDSNKSKNIIASNQECGVRSKSISVEADSAGKAVDPGDEVYLKSDPNSINSTKHNAKIGDVISSDQNNNNLEMTVITHQGSGENIREIQTKIENSEKSATNSVNVNDTTEKIQNNHEKPNEIESVDLSKNEKEEIVDTSENKLISNSSSISDNNKISETPISETKENDDPFARLRAIKANISNALKEVKAVLSEHGEPINEPANESIQPAEENAIRFRFVRRIRKKSTFDDEEDKKTNLEKKEEFIEETKSSDKIEDQFLSNDKSSQDTKNQSKLLVETDPSRITGRVLYYV